MNNFFVTVEFGDYRISRLLVGDSIGLNWGQTPIFSLSIHQPKPIVNTTKSCGLAVNTYLDLRNRTRHVAEVLQRCCLCRLNVCWMIFNVADIVTHCTQLSQDEVIRVVGHAVNGLI